MSDPVEADEGRSTLGVIGYAIAAVIALAAGAWFAIHLSARKTEQAGVAPSPVGIGSPNAATGGPVVALANGMPVQVSGPGATSADRSAETIRKAFEDNRGSLADTFNNALASDPRIADGMLIRLHILPDGSVASGAVRTSTSPDPSLDAKALAAMEMWKLPATNAGEVDADYPIIFARDGAEQSRIESDLQTKITNLSPTEPPEYASAPATEASPLASPAAEAGGAPSAGAASSPAIASAPSPEAAPSPKVAPAPEIAKPKRKPRREPVAHAAPTPSIFEQVRARLKANPKLRRVNAYTSGGTVTLFGKVFGESEKSLAEETVRNVPGVTSVVDTITTDEGEWAEEQTRIARQLANAGLDKVTVKVIGKDAFLDGEVKTELDKSRAVTIAEGAAPVTVRTNIIRVAPGSMFGF